MSIGKPHTALRLALLSGLVVFVAGWLVDLVARLVSQDAGLLGQLEMVEDALVAGLCAVLVYVLVRREVWAQGRTEAARESEDRYRTLFDGSADPVFVETLEGRVIDCNAAACELYGYSREELLKLAVADLVPEEIARMLPDVIAEELASGGIHIAALGKRKDGSVFPTEVHTRLVTMRGERLVLAHVHDMTARKLAQDALRASEAELRALLAAMDDVILVLDAQGRYLKVAPTNPAGLYRPADELIGRTLHDIFPAEQADSFLDCIRRALETRRAVNTEYSLRIAGSDIWFTATVSPMLTDTVLWVARDITERKRAERVQAALYRISEAANTARGLDELFPLIHAIISELTPAGNFYIALFDPATGTLTFPYYVDEFERGAPPQRPGTGLTAYVLRTGKPLLAPPEVFDELIRSGEVELIGARPIDWLGVPLRMQDKIIGVLAVQSYAQGVRFTEADQDMLVFVSTQVAMAIERKRAEEALRRRDAVLAAVGFAAEQFLKTLSWEQVVQGVLANLGEAAGVSRVYIFENEARPDGRLTFSQRYEWVAPGIRPQFDNLRLQDRPYREAGFARWEALLGQNQSIHGLVSEMPDSEQALLAAQDIRAVAAVPVFVGAQWWGFIGVDECREERSWSPAEIDALKAAADALGAAILRQRGAAALAQESNLLRTVIDNLPDRIYVKDVSGRFVLKNLADAQAMGAGGPDEVIGRTDFDFYPAPLAAQYYADDQLVLTSGQPLVNREEPGLGPDSSPRWVLTTKVPLRDGHGTVVGLVGIGRDITEHRQRERELQALLAVASALRAAPTRSAMLSVTLDQVTDLLEADGAALLLRDSAAGDLVVEEVRGGAVDMLGRRLPAARSVSGDVLKTGRAYVNNQAADDPRMPWHWGRESLRTMACAPLTAYAQPIGVLWIARHSPIDEAHVRLLSAIADMAANALHRAMVLETLEQRVAERTQALAEANERLKELDRLKSKFVSDVSHELRTPVTNLKLYLTLLERGRTEKYGQYMAIIKEQTDRLGYLIEGILSLSRLDRDRETMEFVPLDLNEVVAQIVADHRARADAAGLSLAFAPQPDLPLVRGERGGLVQVVTNLVSNAVNYTTAGHVRLSTALCPDGKHACLEVSDTGIGIEAADLPHVFERFYRGQRAAQSVIPGTGLGLAIVKEIVDLHGGRVEVESRLGQGSTFRVWLPLAAVEHAVAADG